MWDPLVTPAPTPSSSSMFADALLERTNSTVVTTQAAAVASTAALSKVDPKDGEAVAAVCESAGVPFVDLDFSPKSAAGCQRSGEPVQWLRLREALEKIPGHHTHGAEAPAKRPVVVVPGASSCKAWLSLVSLTCSAPETLVPQHRGGCARVCLPASVVVDDFLPWRRRVPMHAACTPDPEAALWVPLVEKAYAKQRGGYHRLQDPVDPSRTVSSLTGGRGVWRETPLLAGLPPPPALLTHAAGSLVFLKPKLQPPSPLAQPRALYTVGSVALDGAVLVYTVVVDHPLPSLSPADVDARWVPCADLASLFTAWALVVVDGVALPRRPSPVDLSSFPPAAPPPAPPTPPPLPPNSGGSKVAQLEREVDALTQLHLDALGAGQGARGDEQDILRVRLLKQTLRRLQDENARKVDCRVEGHRLFAFGEVWVKEEELPPPAAAPPPPPPPQPLRDDREVLELSAAVQSQKEYIDVLHAELSELKRPQVNLVEEELRLTVRALQDELQTLGTNARTLEERLAKEQQKCGLLGRRLVAAEEAMEASEDQNIMMAAELAEACQVRAEADQAKAEAAEKEVLLGELEAALQKASHLTQQAAALETDNDKLRHSTAACTRQLSDAVKQVEEARDKLEAEQRERMRAEAAANELRAAGDQLRQDEKLAKVKLTATEKEAEEVRAMLEEERRRAEAVIKELQAAGVQLQNEKAEAARQVKEMSAELEAEQRERKHMETLVKKLEQMQDERREQVAAAVKQVEEARLKLEAEQRERMRAEASANELREAGEQLRQHLQDERRAKEQLLEAAKQVEEARLKLEAEQRERMRAEAAANELREAGEQLRQQLKDERRAKEGREEELQREISASQEEAKLLKGQAEESAAEVRKLQEKLGQAEGEMRALGEQVSDMASKLAKAEAASGSAPPLTPPGRSILTPATEAAEEAAELRRQLQAAEEKLERGARGREVLRESLERRLADAERRLQESETENECLRREVLRAYGTGRVVTPPPSAPRTPRVRYKTPQNFDSSSSSLCSRALSPKRSLLAG